MYKEQKLAMGKMKHEMEESGEGIALKQCIVNELEKLSTLEELGKQISQVVHTVAFGF